MSRILAVTPAERFLTAIRDLIPACQARTETKCIGEVVASAELRQQLALRVLDLLRRDPFAQENALSIIGASQFQSTDSAQKASNDEKMWRALLWLTFIAEKERDCANNAQMAARYRQMYAENASQLPRVITASHYNPPLCFFCDELVDYWVSGAQMSHAIALDWPNVGGGERGRGGGEGGRGGEKSYIIAWPRWPRAGPDGPLMSQRDLNGLSLYFQCLEERQSSAAARTKYAQANAYLRAARDSTEIMQISAEGGVPDAAQREFDAIRQVFATWGTRDDIAQGAGGMAREGESLQGLTRESRKQTVEGWNAERNAETMWMRVKRLSPAKKDYSIQVAALLAQTLDTLLTCGTHPLRDAMFRQGLEWTVEAKRKEPTREAGQGGTRQGRGGGGETTFVAEWVLKMLPPERRLSMSALFPAVESSGSGYFDAWSIALVAALEESPATRALFSGSSMASVVDLHAAVVRHYGEADATKRADRVGDVRDARNALWKVLQGVARGLLPQGVVGVPESVELLHEQFDAAMPTNVVQGVSFSSSSSSSSSSLVSSSSSSSSSSPVSSSSPLSLVGVAAQARDEQERGRSKEPQPLFRFPYWLPYGTRFRHRLTLVKPTLRIAGLRFPYRGTSSTDVPALFAKDDEAWFRVVLENRGPTTYRGALRVVLEIDAHARRDFALTFVGDEKTVQISGAQLSFDAAISDASGDSPLRPGKDRWIDVNARTSRQVFVRVVRAVPATQTELINAVKLSIESTDSTVGYTEWTFASQLSLHGARLSERIGNTRRDAITSLQPVTASLLVPFSRTLVDEMPNGDSSARGVFRADLLEKERKLENLIVLYNDQRENVLYFPESMTMRRGNFSLVAAVIFESSGTFSTMYRHGGAGGGTARAEWFFVRSVTPSSSPSTIPIEYKDFKTFLHCFNHRVVQAWYVRDGVADSSALQKQREWVASLQTSFPLAASVSSASIRAAEQRAAEESFLQKNTIVAEKVK